MPPRRALIVTLMARHYGQPMVSRAEALAYWRDIDQNVTIDYLSLYTANAIGISRCEAVIAKYIHAREVFLAGNWDTFISIEDDMVIPQDTFPRLMRVLDGGADVAYGLYAWRDSKPLWNAYRILEEVGGLSISSIEGAPARYWGTVQDVAGLGMGCTAIERQTLEAIPFRWDGRTSNDWTFALDCQAKGFKQQCDLGLVCGHMAVVDEPVILWPDVTQPELIRLEDV